MRGRARRAANLEQVLDTFPRLRERLGQLAGSMSGGEQQMLAIGRGLMAEPRLLILDEPSLGLSPLMVEELFALIARLHRAGLSILLVEQNVGQSLETGQRACAGRGRDPPQRILRRTDGQRRRAPRLSGDVAMDPVSPSAALRAVVRAGEGGDAVPQTLAQKLIAAACGRETVAEGEIVTCRVDLAMFHDSSGPRRLEPMLREVGARLWDPARVVLVIDHYVPESDEESRRIVRIAREWAVRERLPNLYDSQGICHVVLPQGGHLRPGMFCVGGDSHSPTGGAFGAYMFGIGSTEMLGVAVTGGICACRAR